MKVEAHKDYTVNLGNRNFAKGGFRLEEDAAPNKVDEVKKQLIKVINKWIEEEVQAEKSKFQEEFTGFN